MRGAILPKRIWRKEKIARLHSDWEENRQFFFQGNRNKAYPLPAKRWRLFKPQARKEKRTVKRRLRQGRQARGAVKSGA
jgi:hypothetical protein